MSLPVLFRDVLEEQGVRVKDVSVDADGDITVTTYVDPDETLEETSMGTFAGAYFEFHDQLDTGAMHLRILDPKANEAVLAVCRPEWAKAAATSTDDAEEITPEKAEALRRMQDTRVLVNPEGLQKAKQLLGRRGY
jgi:hypothetical protein